MPTITITVAYIDLLLALILVLLVLAGYTAILSRLIRAKQLILENLIIALVPAIPNPVVALKAVQTIQAMGLSKAAGATVQKQIVAILQQSQSFESGAMRDMLIVGLPPEYVALLRRSNVTAADLSNMVALAAQWDPRGLSDVLPIFMTNAIDILDSSAAGKRLQTVRDENPDTTT